MKFIMYKKYHLWYLKLSFFSVAGWKVRCAEYFPYSTFFEGHCTGKSTMAHNQILTNPENGVAIHNRVDQSAKAIASNGKLEAFKKLTIAT